MPDLVHSDAVFRVDPGKTPDYDSDNPLLRLLSLVEATPLMAEREHYDATALQHLFPLTWLETYGPSGGDADQLDPTRQDNKTDFQKQNVRDYRLADTRAVRGWAATDGWRGAFVQLSYRAGPDSALAEADAAAGGALGDAIGCVVSVGGRPPVTVRAPYDAASGRYVVELWGRSGAGLRDTLGPRGQAALDTGRIQARPDVVRGGAGDFDRAAVADQDLRGVAPEHAMHPVNPFYLDVRWTAGPEGGGAADGTIRLGFEMRVRGWDNYLGVGVSPNPHGGVGFLEYRNLFSEYGRYQGSGELDRPLEPWNFDAIGNKGHQRGDVERFMAVNYMDLHVLDPACGIGLHRHRDNQEVFLMLDGDGYMVIGDWADSGTRARSFEVRRLRAGQLALLKGGNLHALSNPLDRQAALFMFGGYD
jgi:hypothetical protein